MGGEPEFDLLSFGRRGPGVRAHIPSEWLAAIRRTTERSPEVMLKVLSCGATSARATSKHVKYISRRGTLDVFTDSGEVQGKDLDEALDDWNLDLEESRPR